jgi:hypothetical protein
LWELDGFHDRRASPTGITLTWPITATYVDRRQRHKRVYEVHDKAQASRLRRETSGSLSAATELPLAAGNAQPQGIADLVPVPVARSHTDRREMQIRRGV